MNGQTNVPVVPFTLRVPARAARQVIPLKFPSALFAAVFFLAALLPNLSPPAQAQDSAPPAETAASPSGEESALIPAIPSRGKKLVLKDGTFQMAREYERKGDRVRYYSTERSEWEEIPDSLVDWPATEKAAAEAEAAQKSTLERLHAAAAVEIANTIDTGSSLLVGPGVFLPDSAGLYVLDGRTVLGLIQTEASSRLDKGRAILKGLSGIPMISTKRIIEVPGKKAKIRIQSPEPEFFFRTADGRSPQMTLVKASVNGDKRQVTTAVTDMVGQTKYESREIPVMASEAARGVQRLTMAQKLEPGEYALLEMTSDGVSSYVWDFGVDAPSASSGPPRKPPPPARQTSKNSPDPGK